MLAAQELYFAIGNKLPEVISGKLFGKPCFKINGKAFVCFFENEMVFKITGETHQQTLSLANAKLFDPSGKGRPMKEWVQVPYQHQQQWENLAKATLNYALSSHE